MISKNNGYIPIITFLRAIASLGVCAIHMGYAANLDANSYLSKILGFGQQGVPVFFVISGFIIPYSLWNTNYTIKDSLKFIIKRSIRIDPPYLLIIFLVVLRLSFILNETFSLERFLYHLLYLIPFTKETWYIGVFWTLAIEFQFYILISLFFPSLKKANIYIVCAILTGLAFYGHFIPLPNASNFILSHIHCFCIGIICLFGQTGRLNLVIVHAILAVISAYLCFKISYTAGVVPYLTAILILHVNFKTRVSDFFGKISYSLYISHLITGGYLLLIINKFNLSPPLTFILLMAVCTGAAYLLYLIIEKPAIKWSQNYTHGIKKAS